MNNLGVSNNELELALADALDLSPPDESKVPKLRLKWEPRLNPTQRRIYHCKQKYILAYGERGTGKCGSTDVQCYTHTGLSRLEDLRPTEGATKNWQALSRAVMSFDGKKIVPAMACGYYNEPNQEAKHIAFSNGNYLECSPRHPLWGSYLDEKGEITFGYLRSAELQERLKCGFEFYVPVVGHPNFVQSEYVTVTHNGDSETVLTPEVGYLIGVLVGDGGLTTGSTYLTTADQQILDMIGPALKQIDACCRAHKAKMRYNIVGPHIFSLTAALKIRCLSKCKRVPDEIIRSPKSVIVAFLRGLFDTDGWVQPCGYPAYCSASRVLAWDVQNLLQALGVFSTCTYKKNTCAGAWNINIYGEDAWTFQSVVGFGLDRKKKAMMEKLVQAKIPNRNENGYPEFITKEMRRIRDTQLCLGRKPAKWKPFAAKHVVRKREGEKWEVQGKLDGIFFYKCFGLKEEADAFAESQNKARSSLVAHDREWHWENRAIVQSRYVPSPDKLAKFKEMIGTSETLEMFELSTRWVKINAITDTTAKLADLWVPGTNAFVAMGLIHHNSICGLHKLVRHVVHNRNALGVIIVKEAGQALDGGTWHKLMTEILPQWKNGNFDRPTKRLIDEGCGIKYSESKLHHKTKNEYVWISNKFGGWSMIMMMSMFVADHFADKIKAREGSAYLIDEAQTMESETYFTALIQQLGRRPDADEEGFAYYAANPKGPLHWLYQRFFMVEVGDEGALEECPIDPETGHPIHPVTGQPRLDYGVFHVPISENRVNLKKGYWENVVEACGRDEIEAARMLRGEWIDKAEGDALFRDDYTDALNLVGRLNRNEGLVPIRGQTIIIGYDPGSAHTSVHLLQHVVEKDLSNVYKLVFDELNFVGRYVRYQELVERLIQRLQYWEKAVGGYEFAFVHITDDSAFNQFRAGSGASFDAAAIEGFSRDYVKKHNLPKRFEIRMRACPKGPYSVEARVRLVREDLLSGRLKLSAICTKTREMFMQLARDEKKGDQPKRSKHSHPFDSLSYPLMYFAHGRGKGHITDGATPAMKPEFFVVGKR